MKELQQIGEYDIDLFRILKVLWQNVIKIAICSIVCGIIAFSYTIFMVTPLYQANCMIYVNNSSFSVGGSSFSISSADISASQSLVDTYIVILKSRATLNEVIEEAGLEMSYGQLSGMVSASPVNETEIFRVTVTSPDPDQAKLIANTIAEVLPVKVSDIIDGSSVRIVDYAVKPSVKSSPSVTKNTSVGLVIGFGLMSLIVVLLDLFDDVIRNEDYLTQTFDIPILATIPNLGGGSHGRYGYRKYGYRYGYRYGRYGRYSKYGDSRGSYYSQNPSMTKANGADSVKSEMAAKTAETGNNAGNKAPQNGGEK